MSREGLGRPVTAEEPATPRIPTNLAAVREMSWDDIQALFAPIYVDEIAAMQRGAGEALVKEKLSALSVGERRMKLDALLELDAA
jgi:hypothetical protein